ncbi:MAG: hypothetical protein QOE22_333 [Candidatus Parcubacteria bacterium]|jgi:DNA-binding response OmpR family regulator|nr:hypothetical protein [Candidatus Parcubacteria bacterium]
MRILIIEDDPEMLGFLRAHLPARGFVVDGAGTGADGLGLARTNEYDLLLLDLNLPDMPGEAVVAELQTDTRVPPILMLTVVGDADSKVRLLSAGADDYLAKPFSFEELVARMRALLRRPHELTHDVLSTGNLTLDTGRQVVTREGEPLALTRKEFMLLSYLMRHRGTVVPKSRLIEHAWDASSDSFSNALDTHMANLRKKLGEPDPIRTMHGRGYVVD